MAKQFFAGKDPTSPENRLAGKVTITRNAELNGIELQFDGKPHGDLQIKLRALEFRPGKVPMMWYGRYSSERNLFAHALKVSIAAMPEGPDADLFPSFEPELANIEKKEFSLVSITLKDGQVKNHVLFEPSKSKAEAIVLQYVKYNYPEGVNAIVVKPRTFLKEARILFQEGKVLKLPKQDRQTKKQLFVLRLWTQKLADDGKEGSRSEFDSWLANHFPEVPSKEADKIWEQYQRLLRVVKRPEPRTIYQTLYNKLHKIIPNLVDHLKAGVGAGKSQLHSSGMMDLHFDNLGRDKDGNFIIALAHYFEQNGDLVPDPDMQIRIIPEMQSIEAMTYQDQFKYQEVYPEIDGKEMVNLRLKKDLNHFLNQWLSNIIDQGHRIDLSPGENKRDELENAGSLEDITQPEETISIQQDLTVQGSWIMPPGEAFEKQVAAIDLFGHYQQLNSQYANHFQKEKKLIDKFSSQIRQLKKNKAKFAEIEPLQDEVSVRLNRLDEIEKEIAEKQDAYSDALFEIILERAAGKGHNVELNQTADFREYILRRLLDGDWIKDHFPHNPVTETTDHLIDEYFKEKNPSDEEKAISANIKYRDNLVPYALIPKGIAEPLSSHTFRMYDMHQVIKNNFAHLKKYNKISIREATPLELFELLQLIDFSKYLNVSKHDIIDQWERRGEQLFKTLGYPTDPAYPFVSLSRGYYHIQSLGHFLGSKKTGWWVAAHSFRPVADLKKAIQYIEGQIEKHDREIDSNQRSDDAAEKMLELRRTKIKLEQYLKSSTSEMLNEKEKADSDQEPRGKAQQVDIKEGQLYLPIVLIPAGIKEPFVSCNFRDYVMTEVIKQDFPDLLKLNDKNLDKASPLLLFQLAQLQTPSKYGIDVSREALKEIWEQRGEQIFGKLGLPTDPLYPYTRIVTGGFRYIGPLYKLLSNEEKGSARNWLVAALHRPVADLWKAVRIIVTHIEKKNAERKGLFYGDDRIDEKYQHTISGIDTEIQDYTTSRSVIENYLEKHSEKPEPLKYENKDLLSNEYGIYTSETAGDNMEVLEIPVPGSPRFIIRISLVKTSDDDYRIGVKVSENTFGFDMPALQQESSYEDRSAALKAALLHICTYLEVELMDYDQSEKALIERTRSALSAVKKFALENGFDMDEKIKLHEIQLTSHGTKEKPDFSKRLTFPNWIMGNEYFRRMLNGFDNVFFKIIWEDGTEFKSWGDERFKKSGTSLSDGVKSLFRNKSRLTPGKDNAYTEKVVREGQRFIDRYEFSDWPEAQTDKPEPASPAIIKELQKAYWQEADNEYPVNKITIEGSDFHQARLRDLILDKIESLTIDDQLAILDQLKQKFRERNGLEQYEKSLVTIGKKGDKRKAALIRAYLDDMILDNDIWKSPGSTPGVLQLLISILFSDEETIVDIPAKKERAESKKHLSQHNLNKQIEALIDLKDKKGESCSAEEKLLLAQYTGSGGLMNQGATGKGILYEYYTPDEIVEKMWDLAYKFGYTGGRVLEPSVGTGRFLKYAPTQKTDVVGYEINHYAARIAQILYPHSRIMEAAFESIFFTGNIHLKDDHGHLPYELVIGNPPYGEFTGKYAGMGEKAWTKAGRYEEYFITRGLDLLTPGGLLIFIIPSSFSQGGPSKIKELIAGKSQVLDLYRLPNNIFKTTDIGTDIITLKKTGA